MYKFFNDSRNFFFFLVLILFFSFLLFSRSFRFGFTDFFANIVAVPSVFLADIENRFSDKKSLIEENVKLRERVGELTLELGSYRESVRENERLRELLGFREKSGYDAVSAEVVARDPNNWTGAFLMDRGIEAGIKEGAAVCSFRGLIGKVTESSEGRSTVMVITHPAFKTGGMIRASRINGIVTGQGQERLKMLYLPLDSDIQPGEIVVTSGFSRVFPKGIVIGEVITVDKSRSGLYKYAVLKPAARLFSQEEVLCIRD